MARRLPLLLLALCTGACSTAADPAAGRPPIALAGAGESIVARLQAAGIGDWAGASEPATSYTYTRGEGDAVDEWTGYVFDPAGEARCLDGGAFEASIRAGDPKRVVLMLEGGGGCWNYWSCYTLPMAKVDSGDIGSYAGDGLLNRRHPDNPLADWSVVFGSYCDGSVWSGDKDVTYRDPESGATEVTFHRGLRNLSATLDLMRKAYPDPEQIVVTGFSAGGYGTMMGYLATRTWYPEVPIVVLNDSGPWIFNPEQADMVDAVWENWDIARLIPDDCPAECQEQLIFLWHWIMPRDPDVRVGIFMHRDDFTIGYSYLQFGTQFYDNLKRYTDQARAPFPDRFKRYFTDGFYHTITVEDRMYDLVDHDQPLSDWIAALVEGRPDWRDLP